MVIVFGLRKVFFFLNPVDALVVEHFSFLLCFLKVIFIINHHSSSFYRYCHCYFCYPSHCKTAISSPPYNTFGLYHCPTLSSLQSLFSPFSSRSYFNMKWTRLISTINDNLEMLWPLASNSFFFPTIKTFPLLSFATKYQTVPNFLCILHQSWLWLWILSVTLIASFLRK